MKCEKCGEETELVRTETYDEVVGFLQCPKCRHKSNEISLDQWDSFEG